MKRKAAAASLVNPKLNKVSKKDTEEKQQVVIHWLRQNYYLGCGGSTPKAQLFQEYLDMCKEETMEATSNSAFGKLVRTAFPGVQSSRKGPRGAAKHQYKNLLPLTDRSGSGAPHSLVGGVANGEPTDDEDYYEEEEEEAASFGSSSSPVSSPQQCASSSPVQSHHHHAYVEPSSSDSNASFYFSTAPGPSPSSPLSSSPASEDGEQVMSSPTLVYSSYSPSSSSSSSSSYAQPMMTSAWLPPVVQPQTVAESNPAGYYQQYHSHHHHHPHHHHQLHDLPSESTSSFDDIDAYGAEAAAAAELGVWEGDDVEAFFSTAPTYFLAPSVAHRGYASITGSGEAVVDHQLGLQDGADGHRHHRPDEEVQLMWCTSGAGVEDILSANKGEEWINNLLQGCN